MSAGGLRIIFMGTPDFAAEALSSILQSSHEVIAVYTQPPRPKGRGQQLQQSAVHRLADKHGIPVYTPKNFKAAEDLAAFAAHGADVTVVAAYGLILPQALLDAPKYGCLNIHGSLLPRWRGAAPIHRAVLAGDTQTGITIMQMEAGLDTGPMIKMEAMPIGPQDTTGRLHDALAKLGAKMIVSVLDDLKKTGGIEAAAQPDEGVTYADKISKEEARIDWRASPVMIDRQIRAFYPVPGAWCQLPEGRRLKILKAEIADSVGGAPAGTFLNAQGDIACGEGAMRLITVQPEGKTPMEVAAAINGGYIKPGDQLS